MEISGVLDSVAQELGNPSRGKILVVDDDGGDLEAYSSSLRQEGHEVRTFASFREGSSSLESEHFDLIMLKLKEVSGVNADRFWSVRSSSTNGGPSWQGVSIGGVAWIWRALEARTN